MSEARLHLTITTPAQVLVDETDVVALRAEDESGAFGLLPGHLDLLTALSPSVLRWRNADGRSRYCAVRGGVFSLAGGEHVRIACREGVLGDDLDGLQARVAEAREAQRDADRRARVEQLQLQTRTVRQLVRYLQPDQGAQALGLDFGEGGRP